MSETGTYDQDPGEQREIPKVGDWFTPLAEYESKLKDKVKIFTQKVEGVGEMRITPVWHESQGEDENTGVLLSPHITEEFRESDLEEIERKYEAKLLELHVSCPTWHEENFPYVLQVRASETSDTFYETDFSNEGVDEGYPMDNLTYHTKENPSKDYVPYIPESSLALKNFQMRLLSKEE